MAEVGIAGSISAGISLAGNLSNNYGNKSKWRIVGEALLAGVAGALTVPFSALALGIAGAGGWCLVIASVMLGGVSAGVELVNQMLLDQEIDNSKLWVAFILGSTVGIFTLYFGVKVDSKFMTALLEIGIPYVAGLAGVAGGMLIDEIREVKKLLSEKNAYLENYYVH